MPVCLFMLVQTDSKHFLNAVHGCTNRIQSESLPSKPLRQIECLQRLYDVHCNFMTPEVESMSTAEKILNVRLPIELHGQLEQLVQATGRSKSFLTVEALKNYVSQEQWQIADIQAGLQEADRGEFATAEEVRAVYAKYGH